MNWKAISFDWNQARSFLAVAEERSLSAAADVIGVTQPTISRQIAALEEDLDVVLFERSGRSVALTPIGFKLLDHVKLMAEGANLVSLAASGQSQTIEGRVCVTASEVTAAYVLPSVLSHLKAAAPLLELDIHADNQISDLLVRDADIAIRHVRPEQPELFAKLICEEPMRFYATGKYTERFGRPTLEGDHSQHYFLSFGSVEGMLAHFQSFGLKLSTHNFKYVSRSQVIEWEIARQGHAVAFMTDRIAAKFPEFEPVLTEIEPFTIPMWLVAHRELHTSRRIRLVFDLLADFLNE